MKQAILDCMTLKVKPTEAEVDKYMRRPPPAATGKAATTGGHGQGGHQRRLMPGKAATTGGHRQAATTGNGSHHDTGKAATTGGHGKAATTGG
ncbi:Hypothetical predicted protein [Cloeon dipterum]|uniref:Uncharacterized protein n=1 Tax=Cloeon dipterum TaxID=197152 RepID=A0A8S1DZH0_9INSE|nr:Hypothetical predicted protein [Cloeon dipterum]